MFLSDLLEKIVLSFRAFCREWKRWKSLGTRFGEYGGWGGRDQPKSNIFSSMVLVECGLSLSRRSTAFLKLMNVGCFFRGFSCIHCSCWEYKSALSIWLQLKNSKWIIPWWSYHTHGITFLPWSSAFVVDWRDSSLSIQCLLCWTLS